MKYGIHFRLIHLEYKKPFMETGFLNLHDEEHFSTLPSTLCAQVFLSVMCGISIMHIAEVKHM
jgi:hypothetical protein